MLIEKKCIKHKEKTLSILLCYLEKILNVNYNEESCKRMLLKIIK